MIEFDRLKVVFSKLTENEIDILRKQIFPKSINGNKILPARKLFETIVKKEKESDIQLNLLREEMNSIALRKLLQRLTEKVFDGLISKELLFDSDIFDLKSKQALSIRKRILLYDALAYRGITKYALIILNQVIRDAIKIEYYDYLIIALDKKLVKSRDEIHVVC